MCLMVTCYFSAINESVISEETHFLQFQTKEDDFLRIFMSLERKLLALFEDEKSEFYRKH